MIQLIMWSVWEIEILLSVMCQNHFSRYTSNKCIGNVICQHANTVFLEGREKGEKEKERSKKWTNERHQSKKSWGTYSFLICRKLKWSGGNRDTELDLSQRQLFSWVVVFCSKIIFRSVFVGVLPSVKNFPSSVIYQVTLTEFSLV